MRWLITAGICIGAYVVYKRFISPVTIREYLGGQPAGIDIVVE